MGTIVLFWRPLPEIVWQVEGLGAAALHGFAAFGWLTVLVSTFLIDHFELFGLRQAWNTLLGRALDPPAFRERLLYRVVRHPLMVGFLIAFGSTPVMTAGHFLFAGLATAYIFVGTAIEERDLVAAHGDAYLDDRRRVPGFLPIPRRAS
jgi:protein-S-isoprenylcysteine O-methyltransferase Ste14